MANFCGGIKLNPDTFEVRNGVITLVDAHSDDPITETTTPCGSYGMPFFLKLLNLMVSIIS